MSGRQLKVARPALNVQIPRIALCVVSIAVVSIAVAPVSFAFVFLATLARLLNRMTVLRRVAVFLVLSLLVSVTARAQQADRTSTALQTPAAFLGYELGAEFTPHHRVVDYVRHVADTSPRVALQQYGTSVEGRPLLLATVTSTENHEQIDAIRTNNLRRAGQADGAVSGPTAAVVWLSYNVHGNESVSTEAAMQTLHALADPANDRTGGWLDDTVVLLDPCLNPDGRERYVQWYKRTVGRTANATPIAREHDEPWPNGRTNHYYFDLNRDWAWAVQPETRQRLNAYHRWMPHVHVDFHEQGIDEPYYFAPAANPFHEDITSWQRDFQFDVGRNNAQYFDRNGWLYFTREVFDLFYPGYGDTWPIFNGAIGMTYEQGGSGRAGRAVVTATGDTLTLADRIAHHHTTGLSTVEVTADNADRVQREFEAYYETAATDPPGPYTGYLVKADARGDRLAALAAHLDRQQIRYGFVDDDTSVRGTGYADGEPRSVTAEPGDLLVQAAQPKARLAKVLMEPRPTIIDSLTYDVTAWGLPYAYGLDAVALSGTLPGVQPDAPSRSASASDDAGTPYALLARWGSRADARFLAALLQHDVSVRVATKPFEIAGTTYDAGTLVILQADNRSGDYAAAVRRLAARLNRPLDAVDTGFTDEGPDFGSSNVKPIDAPHVAVLSGDPLSPYRVGEAWYALDHQLRYPATLLQADDVDAAMLRDVDVLVLPDAGSWATDDRREMLADWVRAGGHLVALGDANQALAAHAPFALKKAASPSDPDSLGAGPSRYAERRRDALVTATPGSIHRATVDASHPLGFGMGETYFTLKRSADAYPYLDDGWNVATLPDGAPVSGFMGHKAQQPLDDTLVFGQQSLGDGSVTYFIDNPLFRGFWYAGQIPFANAVFLHVAE